MPKKFHIIFLFLSLIGFIPIQAQPPCLSDFRYRRAIVVTNPDENPQEGVVQIKFRAYDLINAGKMRSDCADIRFTNSTGGNLRYWIDTENNKSNEQSIWVEIPEIATGASASIYMFYGNINAYSTADTAVFDLFDHFENSESLDNWRVLGNRTTIFSNSMITVGSNTSLTSVKTLPRDFKTFAQVSNVILSADSVIGTIGQALFTNEGYGMSFKKDNSGTNHFEVKRTSDDSTYLPGAVTVGASVNTSEQGLWAFSWRSSDKYAAAFPPYTGSIELEVDSIAPFPALNTHISVKGSGSMTLDWIATAKQGDIPFTYILDSDEDDLGTGTVSITGTTRYCEDDGDNLALSANFISGSYYTWIFNDNDTILEGTEENVLVRTSAIPAYTGNYRVAVSIGSPSCASQIATAEVIVDPTFSTGIISSNNTVCEAINKDTIKLSGYSGTIDYWEYRILPGSVWNPMNVKTDYYAYSGLTQSYAFRAYIDGGACGADITNQSIVTVNPTSDGGTLFDDKVVCYNDADILHVKDFTGSLQHWEYKTKTSNWDTIFHTNDTLSYSSLNDSTWYRVSVKSGVCDAAYSNTILRAVSPPTDSGYVDGGKYVCTATEKIDTIQLNDYVGNVLHWESSLSTNGPWEEHNFTTNIFTYQGLVNTTYFRARVESPGCDAKYSRIDTVIVEQNPEAGILTGSTTVCETGNSGTLRLTGYSGKITKWIISADSANTWSDYTHTVDTLKYNNLTDRRHYQVILNSAHNVCANDSSTIAAINVSPETVPGTLSTLLTHFCADSNKGTINIINKAGNVSDWETSPNGLDPWSGIGRAIDSLEFEDLPATNYYRAIVKSGVCGSKTTDSIRILIDLPSVGGNIIGSTEVCEQVNSGALTVINYRGNVNGWLKSLDGVTYSSITSDNTEEYNYTNLTDTTFFKAILQSGVCKPDTSTAAKITVNPLPDVSFTAEAVNLSNPSVFVNTTTITGGSVQSWFWDFGNDESSVSKNPKYTYPESGTYTAKLTATSNKLCVDSASATVQVFDLPDVDFSFENVCLYSPMIFTNTSNIVSGTVYVWNFGDGSTEVTSQDASYVYLESGEYDVTLKAISGTEGTDSITKRVTVYPRSVPNFVVNNICEGSIAKFSNRTQPTSLSLTYEWDFGNGQIDQRSDPESTYEVAGSYVIQLNATTNNGCEDSVLKSISVFPVPTVDFTVEDVPYQQASVFFNLSQIAYGKLNYTWDFGDGNTSDSTHPIYYYESPGVYSVELTAESDSGCVSSVEKEVKIFSLPVARFTFTDVCLGDSMFFTNESTIGSGTLSYEWSFDDNTTSEEDNPVHLYEQAGNYVVRLICISDKNGRDTIYHEVTVSELPVVDFEFNEACDGFTTHFANTSSVGDGEIASILWDFGDGSNSVQLNPDKDYLNPAIYPVELEIISSSGCKNQVVKNVIVHHNPVTDFFAENVCHGSITRFFNSTTIDNSNRPYTLTYNWNFNDGAHSSAKEPGYEYPAAGIYEVTLTTSTDAGCIDSLKRYIEVFELPEANAGPDTTVTKGFPIILQASGGIYYEWMPEEGISNVSIPDPEARPMETTTYSLRVTDENNCINFDTLTITVEDELRIIPSNILTPNNNNENDTWNIVNIDSYPDAEIKIFDRWGKLIYKTSNYLNDWEGTNSNGDILPDGTYYYVIMLSKEYNVVYKGAITILRDK